MNEVEQAQAELIEEFGFFDNWMDRYQYLIDLGRRLPPFPREAMTDANKLQGCQSQVWIIASEKDGRVSYQATSDAAIVSGLIAILLRIYSGRRAEEILKTPVDFASRIGLDQHLSPTRSNGLAAMLQAIRTYAAESLAE
jgi:cysteine desulfuration protein SufE